MFKKSAAKLGKKRGGILHVFQKTVNDLEKLDETTKSQIKTQEDKIKKETEPITEAILEKVAETIIETSALEDVAEKEIENTTEPVLEKISEEYIQEATNMVNEFAFHRFGTALRVSANRLFMDIRTL